MHTTCLTILQKFQMEDAISVLVFFGTPCIHHTCNNLFHIPVAFLLVDTRLHSWDMSAHCPHWIDTSGQCISRGSQGQVAILLWDRGHFLNHGSQIRLVGNQTADVVDPGWWKNTQRIEQVELNIRSDYFWNKHDWLLNEHQRGQIQKVWFHTQNTFSFYQQNFSFT